jgi:hypothetical protein
VGELLQLIAHTIVLTEGLFTENCSLAMQLRDLEKELQEQEQHIMGNPGATAALIPQIYILRYLCYLNTRLILASDILRQSIISLHT